MMKSTVSLLFFSMAIVYSFGQPNNSLYIDAPQAYYVPYAGVRGMMYAECYEWNALDVFQKRYDIQLGEYFAGCIPTEETAKAFKRMQEQNELVNQQFRKAGLISEKGTVDELIIQEYQRQKRIDDLIRAQDFFKDPLKKNQSPVFIKSEALDTIGQYTVNVYQEDRYGRLMRFNQAFVNLSSGEVSLLNPPLIPGEYPWPCYAGPRNYEEPCVILDVRVGLQSDCDPQTNTYIQEMIIEHRMVPPHASVVINKQRFPYEKEHGFESILLENLAADGEPVSLDLLSTYDRRNCGRSERSLFIAPPSCKNDLEKALPGFETEMPLSVPVSMHVFPNPTYGNATIRIELDQSSQVQLGIFNLNGQLIRQVFSGKMEAGVHQLDFDGKNVARGTYLVRLLTGNNIVLTQRMVIIE